MKCKEALFKVIVILIILASFSNCKNEINDSRLNGLFSNNEITQFSTGTMTTIDEVYFDNNIFRISRKLIKTDGEESGYEHSYKTRIIKKNNKGGIFYAIIDSFSDESFNDPLLRNEYIYSFNGNELVLEWKTISTTYVRGRPLIETVSNSPPVINQPIKSSNWRNVEQVDRWGERTGKKMLFGDFESANNTLTISLSNFICSFTIKEGRRDLSLNDSIVLIRTTTETIFLPTFGDSSYNWISLYREDHNFSSSTHDSTRRIYDANTVLYNESFRNFLKNNTEFRMLFQLRGTNSSSLIFNINTSNFSELYEEMMKSWL
jgi:hypothetical protein